jgi:DNA replication and repair protein RecF
MYLTYLSLTNFRNYVRLEVDVPRGPVLLHGANAQGKTSLLEAIYFLATFTSFHASSDRELVNLLAARDSRAESFIVAEFNKGDHRFRLGVGFYLEKNHIHNNVRLRKEIVLDGDKCRMSDAMGYFNSVLFLPQMMQVIEGAPDLRRRYLNLLLAQIYPGYSASLSDYARALSQRNALLKQINERRRDENLLEPWDMQLASSGAQLIYARINAIQELEQLVRPIHRELTPGGEVLRLDYAPSYDPLPEPQDQYSFGLETSVSRSAFSVEQILQGFQAALIKQRQDEIRRGVTTIGPHRDDLLFRVNEVDFGKFGSRGQVRTAMLALKLAEMEWMQARSGQMPVLLMDEVLAELDAGRRADLLTRLSVSEQAFLTTADLGMFPKDFLEDVTLWRVADGLITEQSV